MPTPQSSMVSTWSPGLLQRRPAAQQAPSSRAARSAPRSRAVPPAGASGRRRRGRTPPATPRPSASTRSRSSISATAARRRLSSGTGSRQVRGDSSPESTRRLSALRRIRVARWSSRKRSASASGSCSLSSRWLSRLSWRCSRFWFRRARLTSRSAVNRRRLSSAADSCSVSRSERACSSSVVRQKMNHPDAGRQHRDAVDQRPLPGPVCAAGVVEHQVSAPGWSRCRG